MGSSCLVLTRSLLFLLFSLLLPLFSLTLVFATSLTCTFVERCGESETEAGVLRAQNDTGGYNNAHVQLMTDEDMPYPWTLCCVVDQNHKLFTDCEDKNPLPILRASATINAHVEVPELSDYESEICLEVVPGGLSCEYVNTTCSASYSPLLSMASSEPNNGVYNQTNNHVANYSFYTLNVCCRIGNTPPSIPVLTYPLAANTSVFERNITFTWEASTDADGDAITYDWNLTQQSCADHDAFGIVATSVTSVELCIDESYNWTVRACDATSCSDWAPVRNFTILSQEGITFTTNTTSFGEIARNGTDNTTDDLPLPFNVQNAGNVRLDVTFRAENALFVTSGLGTSSFQYKARQKEIGAYDSAQTDWTNVSATYTALYTNFNYMDGNDEALIDLLVAPPYEEPGGEKSVTLTVKGDSIE